MDISTVSAIILATPKSQNQGMVMRNERLWHGAMSLLNDHNTESGFLAKPHRINAETAEVSTC